MGVSCIHAFSGKQTTFSEGVANPFRYCGEYFDIFSNTYYLRNRYYNPRIGRFTIIDLIQDDHNWYVYCNNNPINYIDPYGTEAYELFDSLDALLLDWAWNYSDISFTIHREVGSTIYSIGSGENIKFSYTYAWVGEHTSVDLEPTLAMVPEGANKFSYIHTHTIPEQGYYEGLSKEDMELVDKNNISVDYKSGFAVTNRGDDVAIYGYGLMITEINSYIDWNDPSANDIDYVEQFDELRCDDVAYAQMSYEREMEVLSKYPLSQNQNYQKWKKRKNS